MGYDIKLLIGRALPEGPEYKQADKPEIDGDVLHWPYLEDAKGKWIPTGRTEIDFRLDIILDLCVIGHGPLGKLVEKAKVKVKKPKTVYKWYFDGDTHEDEDCYGDRFTPVSIEEVVKALEKELKDTKEEPYRRFQWALALLKSMQENGKDIEILFYGH